MNNWKQLVWLWGPVIVWAGLIFFLSGQPTLPSATKVWGDFLFKKSAHMFVYGVLYFLLVRALKAKTYKGYALAFVLCFSYAVSDEIHQSFTPGRHPTLMDVGFDTLGMGIVHLKLRGLV